MLFSDTPCTAFAGSRCIATGPLKQVAPSAKAAVDAAAHSAAPLPVLIFADATSEVIELDWRGSASEFQARLESLAPSPGDPATPEPPDAAGAPSPADPATRATAGVGPEAARGPGRPKLGVVAREVTLLPRHWEWLGSQPGGASVALRKLVDMARRSSELKDRIRQASAVAYRFMSTMAGHEPGFEEASRALFAGDLTGFEAQIAGWPVDVQAHLKKLATDVFRA
jgi:hypothetical protein